MEVTPYNSQQPKKAQVEEMFDSISEEYDLLNSILSLGIHRIWRRKMIRSVTAGSPETILDVATGTADVALEAARRTRATITGIDLSEKMLEIGRKKVKIAGLENRIVLGKGDAESLPFSGNTFDAVTVAFGVRNFGNLTQGLTEMRRVLKPGKCLYILEFSRIENAFLRSLFGFYFRGITPAVARIFTRDTRAYRYLPESVEAFPHGEALLSILRNTGFREPRATPYSFGTATLYEARK
ncbi:MAG: bifunctional demethylmenaquinone methyltransferase/2-methoxy-6-polyprenyl-1,4-benzoquinol methylase UbiE [Bacteroidia bacterium]|nr:bifunctional demethylmenaquinone methyltransferase/2-methoxy-6-polyprenyl-1,4-benzoquinol methylase UbiE [Bacteroidia bacterium]